MIKSIHHLFFFVNNFTEIYPTSFTELSVATEIIWPTNLNYLLSISLHKRFASPNMDNQIIFLYKQWLNEIKNSFVSYLGNLIFLAVQISVSSNYYYHNSNLIPLCAYFSRTESHDSFKLQGSLWSGIFWAGHRIANIFYVNMNKRGNGYLGSTCNLFYIISCYMEYN